jgi:hypothetical protein
LGEDIAHLIDADSTASISAPIDEKITALTIFIGQSQPAAASFFRGADFCHAHQGSPQSIPIDLYHFTRRHIVFLRLPLG